MGVCDYSVFVLSCVLDLRRADHSSKESYWPTEKSAKAKQRAVEP
jgi:hypothetical protein